MTTLTPTTGGDGFILVFSPIGTLRHTLLVGGSGTERISAIAADREGGVFAAVTSTEGTDVAGHGVPVGGAVLSLRSDATIVWAREIESSVLLIDDLAARAGHIVAFGSFDGTVVVSGGHAATSRGESDAFFARWSSDGTFQRLSTDGAESYDFAFHGALLDDGSVAVASGLSYRPDGSISQRVLWRIDGDGEVTRRVLGVSGSWYAPIVADETQFYTAHAITGTLALDATETVSSTGGLDTVVVGWSNTLAPVWWAQSTGPGDETALAIAIDGARGVAVAGTTEGGASLGGSPATPGEHESGFVWSVERR